MIEFGCIAIAAFVMALGEALRREPRVWAFVPFRHFFQSRNWRFIPAIFVALAAIVWLGNQLQKLLLQNIKLHNPLRQKMKL